MKFNGLTVSEITKLRSVHGHNLLPAEKPFSVLNLILSQLKSPLIYILIGVIVISLFLRESVDAILIFCVILLNVLMGFFQEYSAQKTLAELHKIITPQSTVIRDGKRVTILSSDILPGDLVVFGSGDTVPSDGLVVEGTDIYVNEAVLTGEEEPVFKCASQNCQVFMGTIVTGGRGIYRTTAIGSYTEMGKIGQSISKVKDVPTPLQKKLSQFSKSLMIMVVVVSLIIFTVGIFLGQDIREMFRYSVILAVAVIPEGLPIAVTIILSLGMKRILKKKGLVKKLLSIETLGATSVICMDKTGTLTKGIMHVVKTGFKNHREAIKALTALNSRRTPIEFAIWKYLRQELGYDPQKLSDKIELLHEQAFESEKRFAKTVAKIGRSTGTYIIGAPEVVIGFCRLSKTQTQKIKIQLADWANSGLRVLALCQKSGTFEKSLSGFEWNGLIGIKDPVREEVGEYIKKAQKAGIGLKIVTGDYLPTALRVAKEAGLYIPENGVMSGEELDTISVPELRRRIGNIICFARVAPLQKLKIIEALQANGEVVAMTGDGVNDGPALKKADIGIAVGTATDVAKSASDLILMDSNFKTIISAIEEGRVIFANIKKTVAYVLSNSFAEIVLIMTSVFLGLPLPLTVVQILWIHLICDGPPDIVLGFEPKETGVMLEKPRKLIQENILDFSMLFLIFAISLTVGGVALYSYVQELTTGSLLSAQTVAFAVIGSIDLIYVFAYKDLHRSLLKTNLLNNRFLIGAVIYGFILLFSGIYLKPLNQALSTTPLSLSQWRYALVATLITLIWVELVKLFNRPQAQKSLV